MPILNDFIVSLAKKAGLSIEDESIKAILANDALKVPFDDALANTISNTLMSKAEAKNNIEIKSHFTANALDAVDRSLELMTATLELSDDEKAVYKEKKTYERMDYLNSIVNAKIEAKTSAAGKDKNAIKDEYQKQLDAVKKQLEDVGKEKDLLNSNFTAKLGDMSFNSFLSTMEFDTERIPKDIVFTVAKQMTEKYLGEKGAKAVFDGEKWVLKNAASPDLEYMENGNAVKYSDIVSRVAAENKLLKVTNPNPTPAPSPRPQPTPQPNSTGNNNYDPSVIGSLRADLLAGNAK